MTRSFWARTEVGYRDATLLRQMKVERGHRAYPTHSEVLVIWRPWWKRDLFIATPSSSTSSTLQLTDRQTITLSHSFSKLRIYGSFLSYSIAVLLTLWPRLSVPRSVGWFVGLSVCCNFFNFTSMLLSEHLFITLILGRFRRLHHPAHQPPRGGKLWGRQQWVRGWPGTTRWPCPWPSWPWPWP